MTATNAGGTRDQPGRIALATAKWEVLGLAVVGLGTLLLGWISPGPPDYGAVTGIPAMFGMQAVGWLYFAEPPRRRSAVVVGMLTWAVAAACVGAVVECLVPAFLDHHAAVVISPLVGMPAGTAAFAAVLRRG